MAYILMLLFISPFLNRKESRWFLVFYAFILLFARELRWVLEDIGITTEGRLFFEFYSLVQFFCIFGAGYLLSGWQRVLSVSVFIVFSLYNMCISCFWGSISIMYYDWISLAVIIIQSSIVTITEKSAIKNICMILIAWMTTIISTRYI